MMNYGGGYNPNTWMNTQPSYQQFGTQQNQMQTPMFATTFVSDIAEAVATKPDVTGKPLFFYNKSQEEIYVKQYDNSGAAPVKTYKLVIETNEPQNNPVLEGFKALDTKLEDIKKLLTPTIDDNDKRNRR